MPSPPETQMISDSLSNTTTPTTLTNPINIYSNKFIKNMNLSGNDGNSTAGKATTQACAACKYQRKKCVPDCILAPYFPHDRKVQFLNAHKLFGVSNITKIIKNLNPIEKDEAMRTIIFQSDVRATDPVGGCFRIIRELQTQIEYNKAELDLVLQQLAIFRAQTHRQQHNQPHPNEAYVTTLPANDVNAPALRNGSSVGDHHDHMIHADPLSLYNNSGGVPYHYLHPQPHQQDQYGMVQMSNSSGSNYNTTHMDDPSSWGVQNTKSTLSTLSLHGNNTVGDEYESRTLLLGMPSSDNQYRFDIPEEFERSEEAVSFKVDDEVLIKAGEDPFHQLQDHDLKDAAHLFTLTNCNS